MSAEQHDREDRCYYCASDEEIVSVLDGRPDFPGAIRMDTGPDDCPVFSPRGGVA